MRTELGFQWNVVEEEVQAGFCKLQNTLDGLFSGLQAVLVGKSLSVHRTEELGQAKLDLDSDSVLGYDLSVLEYVLSAQMHNVTYRIQRAKEGYSKEMRYASTTDLPPSSMLTTIV